MTKFPSSPDDLPLRRMTGDEMMRAFALLPIDGGAAPVGEDMGMDTELSVSGAIVDSWIEPSGIIGDESRVVLQVAPWGRPGALLIVEASTTLVPDLGWREDLSANLCHGSPVAAIGRLTVGGMLAATRLELDR